MTKLLLCFLLLLLTSATAIGECFPETKLAEQIYLVVPVQKTGSKATLAVINRNRATGEWGASAPTMPAIIGKNGLAWSHAYKHRASSSDAIKVEGDKRTPAGIYPLTQSFGFSDKPHGNHIKLEAGKQFCVDDPRSAHYNKVIPNNQNIHGYSGENMPAIPLYRNGIFIDYPTNRSQRSGSCIFLHVWNSPLGSTAGCIALAEADVIELQRRAAELRTQIAILPQPDAEALLSCLQGKG